MDGIIVVNKPQNITSFGVCARLRKILNIKKIGHTGTLDPMAEGVLVVCVGNAAKLIEYIKAPYKIYEADIKFGLTTDTQDIWGEVLSESRPSFSEQKLLSALDSFKGCITQTTPIFSACKVEGKKLYSYAREKKEVTLPKREVTIHEITVNSLRLPNEAHICVKCSKGTYIRALCDDLGRALGCGAVMSALTRTYSDGFCISQARTFDEIEECAFSGRLDEIMLSSDSLISYMPKVEVCKEAEKLLYSGNVLPNEYIKQDISAFSQGDKVRIYCGESFAALGEASGGKIQPRKVFI